MVGGQHPLAIIQEAELRRNALFAEAERERRALLAQPRVSGRQPWLALLAVVAIVVGLALQLATGPEGAREPPQPSVAPARKVDVTETREADLLDPGAARQRGEARW